MTNEIIILCQGTQSRLGMAHGYKQLLNLPACGVPILKRTLEMLRRAIGVPRVTILGWPEMFAKLPPNGSLVKLPIRLVTLPDPGNSSLKGVARYLESRDTSHVGTTMVLLGDVVYSWACLEAIRAQATVFGSGFVGTAALSPSGGELWGVGWDQQFEDPMVMALRDALMSHPPFTDEYQPGQLRRWLCPSGGGLVERVASLRKHMRYAAIDDYTMDVDLPRDIARLDDASQKADADDAIHDLYWKSNAI